MKKSIFLALAALVMTTLSFAQEHIVIEDIDGGKARIDVRNIKQAYFETSEAVNPGIPIGNGTLRNPYNVDGAIARCNELGGAKSTEYYYIKGKIASIKDEFSAQWGYAHFTISNDGTTNGATFTAHNVLYIGKNEWNYFNPQVHVGDEVILCAKIQIYDGIYETAQDEGYIYSLNNVTKFSSESPYYYVYGRATKTSADNAYMFVMTPVEGNESAYTYTTKFTSIMDMLIWNSFYWKNDLPVKNFSRVYGTEVRGSKELEGRIIQGSNQNYFISPTAAFYTFTIDFEAQTFKWTKLEDQNPTSYTNISLIGVDGDWSTDIDLAVVDRNKHNWYLRYTFVADTELKFRANHAWTTDWGFGDADGAWNAGSEWAKICKNGAKNIKVPKGTYDICFCDITGAAHFIPVEE